MEEWLLISWRKGLLLRLEIEVSYEYTTCGRPKYATRSNETAVDAYR